MLSHSDFTVIHKGLDGTEWDFALDVQRSAAALRKLASSLETGEILLQDVLVAGRAPVDDFSRTTLVLKLHEKRPSKVG